MTPDQRVVAVLQRAVGGAAAERDVRALTELTRDELTAAINRLRAAGTVKVRTARMGAVGRLGRVLRLTRAARRAPTR